MSAPSGALLQAGRGLTPGAAPTPRSTEIGNGVSWDTLPAFALVGAVALGAAFVSGTAARLLYPVAAIFVGGALLGTRRVGAFLCFSLWLFILTPWLRRWVDLHAGWLVVNPIMMAPWFVAALSLIVLLRLAVGPGFRSAGAVLTVVVAASYGLTVATLQGRAIAGVFDWLRYVAPLCLGGLVILSLPRYPSIPKRILRVFALGAALTGIYAAYQFAYTPPWDVLWMLSVPMETSYADKINAFEFRVFSLMNSPGSYAAFLGAVLPFLLALPGPLHSVGLVLGLIGLLLTQIRSFWLGAAVALGYLVVRGPFSLKGQAAAVAVAGVMLLAPLTLVAPEAVQRLEQRLDTMTSTQIGGDVSLNDRRLQYRYLADQLDRNPQGEGLAVSGGYQTYLDNRNFVVFDGQFMEVFLALGVFGGTLYFGAVAYCVANTLRLARRGCSRLVLAASAVALEAVAVLPLASPFIGEAGVFFWVGIALCYGRWRPDVPASGSAPQRWPAVGRP